MYGGARSTLPARRASAPRRRRGTIGPRSMPCGSAFELLEGEAVGLLAVAVAERAGAQREVEQALAAAARRTARARPSAPSSADRPRRARRRRPVVDGGDVDVVAAHAGQAAPPSRMRISHSSGRPSAGGKTGVEHVGRAADRERARSGRRGAAARAATGRGGSRAAWRVVSFSQLSTLIMQSSPASASSSRSPPGVDSTGLPATVNSARIWPSPGVAISSARHDTGTWPEHLGRAAHAALPAAEVSARRPRARASAGR